MRAVVDTNILVSALLHADRLPAKVVSAIGRQQLVPVVCEAAMREYAAVLLRPRFGFAAADVNELLVLIEQQAEWVEVPAYTGAPALPDAADWPFVACALATRCPVVTGNVKHFPARVGVKVMTAREWVDSEGAGRL